MRLLLTAGLLLAGTATADSWVAFQKTRYVSPDGKHALVVHPNKAFQLDGVAGQLSQLPLEVHVRNNGKGAILFECYGNVGHRDSVSLLSPAGKLVWRIKLADLFDPLKFQSTMSSIWWSRAWWVDEARQRVVVVSKKGGVRDVALRDGAVTKSGDDAIVAGFPHPAALELALERKIAKAKERAKSLAADNKQPVLVRFLAASIVDGGKVPEPLVKKALKLPSKQCRIVLRHLGKEHLELLETAARDPATAWDALRAIARLGSARRLASVINSDVTKSAQDYAATLLGELPAKDVAKAIAAEFDDADAAVGGALLRAGIAANVPDLDKLLAPHERVLVRALGHNTAPIEWLADHFTQHASTEAVQPLLKALREHERNRRRQRKIVAALKACTGLDFGETYAGWAKGLRR